MNFAYAMFGGVLSFFHTLKKKQTNVLAQQLQQFALIFLSYDNLLNKLNSITGT